MPPNPRRRLRVTRGERELRRRIQDLPQELHDMIRDFTLTVNKPSDNVITIDEKYKPPVQLQISSTARKAVAKEYYTNTIFNFQHYYGGEALCVAWLDSLSQENQDQLQVIRLQYIRANRLSDFSGARPDQLAQLLSGTTCHNRAMARNTKSIDFARMAELLHVNVERTLPNGVKEEIWMALGKPYTAPQQTMARWDAVVINGAEV